MKLSTRLHTLSQSITPNVFHHIWDCCCDHGYLGQQLMLEHPNSLIHFVDVMPHLVDEVTLRLGEGHHDNWATHCISAEKIELQSEENHLIIIAGVGGDLLLEIVTAIISQHDQQTTNNRIDFILCPVRQLHKVRHGLNTLKLGLVNEKIVRDNQQFYEIIHVSNHSNRLVSPVGDCMWDASNIHHQVYRNSMIAHYKKQPSKEAKKLLALYQEIH